MNGGCLNKIGLGFTCLIILLCFCYCTSPRNLHSDTKTDWSNELSHLSNKMDSLRINLGLDINRTNEKLSNMKFNKTVINYSVPDSTGKQYVISESKTEGERNDEEKEHANIKLQAELTRISNKVDSLYDLVLRSKREAIKEVKLSWWNLYKDKVYIGCMVLIIAWLVYKKRYK